MGGGSLIEQATFVPFHITLPAIPQGGNPSWPITAKLAFQFQFKYI